MKKYYKAELKPILDNFVSKKDSTLNIQVTSGEEKTKYLGVNLESIEVIKEALNQVEAELIRRRK